MPASSYSTTCRSLEYPRRGLLPPSGSFSSVFFSSGRTFSSLLSPRCLLKKNLFCSDISKAPFLLCYPNPQGQPVEIVAHRDRVLLKQKLRLAPPLTPAPVLPYSVKKNRTPLSCPACPHCSPPVSSSEKKRSLARGYFPPCVHSLPSCFLSFRLSSPSSYVFFLSLRDEPSSGRGQSFLCEGLNLFFSITLSFVTLLDGFPSSGARERKDTPVVWCLSRPNPLNNFLTEGSL